VNSLRAAALVAVREIRERTRANTFRLSTGLIALLAIGAVAATTFLPDLFEDDPARVAVADAGTPEGLAALLAGGSLGAELRVTSVPAAEDARQLVLDGAADAALFAGPTIAFRDEADPTLEAQLTQAYRLASLPAVLAELDLTIEQARPLVDPGPIDVTLLEPPTGEEATDDESGVAAAAVILLLMSLTLYGSWILNGVVEEKTSRVVEVLMGALRPWQLLLGKVAGILALAVGQLAVGVGSAVAAIAAFGNADLPSVGIEVAIAAVAYGLLGLLLYAFVFAAAGATVSRQEDAQTVAMPITFTLVAAYAISLTVVIEDADGLVARVASILPLSSPLAMTPRLAVTDPPLWEVALSLALLVVSIPLVIRLAGRIYAGAILQTGPRTGLLTAWRAARETLDR
jgi:ABC-2 type transport system permease protein